MEIKVDIDSPEPLFAQLIEQIKDAVKDGYLKPGDALPSIRQLANDLELNNKTVAKAYRLLERDSVIQTKGYRGTFIHPAALENSKTDMSAWVLEQITATVTACRTEGATDSEIRIAFGHAMQAHGGG
ncbi:GntR family transcriptional regulator [Kordiimonas sp.]|uniref:GntR family transcriptional regulator n=1 Tax=Kordiimonas sp. TaxID=1970157 RepID=UPI003A8D2652